MENYSMKYWNSDLQDELSGQEKKKFLCKKRILKKLYRNDALSGADIARILNLSSPTTQVYLNELINEKYIEYRGKGESIGGRRPNMYGLIRNSVYLLGIDVSQKKITVSLFNNDFENITGIKTRPLKLGRDLAAVDEIYNFSKEVMAELQINESKIIGIGINMPGLIDSEKGINYTYLTDTKKPIQKVFQDKFKIPVYIENDSKARALAELRLGLAKECQNALVIQLGWGVGTGMILNGKLYKGNSGFSGEFSHILIEEDGQLCTCGRRGCLETLASGRALVEQATLELKNNPNSILQQVAINQGGQLFPDDIVNAAKKADQLALSLIENMGQKLGKGISYLIQILNPELIILGGAVSQANEYLLTPINQALYSYCIPKLREDTTLKVSQLGIEAGVLGAVSVVLERSIDSL